MGVWPKTSANLRRRKRGVRGKASVKDEEAVVIAVVGALRGVGLEGSSPAAFSSTSIIGAGSGG